MKQLFSSIHIPTRGISLYEFTSKAAEFIAGSTVENGLLTCFARHTSASLVIQENADPDVLRDLKSFLDRLVPRDEKLYLHTSEGPDDMPSHIRSMLTQSFLSVPVLGGKMVLGTWQGLYLFEHRDAPHNREVVLHCIGD